MCLIVWEWNPENPSHLLIAGNRDEHFKRPTAPLHWWEDIRILAGRDLLAGGTWMGVGRSGRVAALTNYRDPALIRQDAPSRGSLVRGFLEGSMSCRNYLQSILNESSHFNPFNLLVFDGSTLMGLESRHKNIINFGRGVGGVSNADFNTPWPKVVHLHDTLLSCQGVDEFGQDEVLWRSLSDRHPVKDSALPQTGISIDQERVLSSAFISTPDYGTRSSTLIRLKRQGSSIEEKRFSPSGFQGSTKVFF